MDDTYRKSTIIDGETCYVGLCKIFLLRIEIFDVLGAPEYLAQWDAVITSCQGFVFVYSITSEASLHALNLHVKQVLAIKQHRGVDVVPMVLCGNKSDLANERAVSSSMVSNFAQQVMGMSEETMQHCVLETSAKCRTNIDEAVWAVVRLMRKNILASSKQNDNKSAGKCIMM